MKTLFKFLFFAACISLMMACQESPEISDDLAGVELKSAPGGDVVVFTVNPTGDDDTQVLKEAFDAAIAAGHGSVVQLTEGEYKIGFTEIREFFGIFRGAGKGKTVITACDELNFAALDALNLKYHIIKFVGGDFVLSDMTIKTYQGATRLDGLINLTDYNHQYTSENLHIKTLINNVEFIGQPATKTNCICGVVAQYDSKATKSGGWPRIHSDLMVTNCVFDNFNCGLAVWGVSEGKLVAGTVNGGNIFRNCITESLSLRNNINMEMSVARNTFYNTKWAIFLNNVNLTTLADEPQFKSTLCNFEHNVLNVYYVGIILWDVLRANKPEENFPMLIQVKNNQINMSEGTVSGIGAFNLAGVVIRNNKFSGISEYGVRVRTNPYGSVYNENGLMLGNNFTNTVFSKATVQLERYTRNWTIVGSNVGENIINDHPEGNNLITGMNVNTSDVPLGQTITDNLEEMRDGIKNW